MDHLVRHFGPHKVVESLPCTMARNQIVRINILEGRDHLPNVLVGQWRYDVEAADDRVHFLDTGSGLRLLDCVDDAAVTAGSKYDQTLVFDYEVRSDLMLKIIENKAAGIFRRWNSVRETSEAVDDPDFLAARPQRLLESAQRDLAGGKGVIGNDGRAFRHHEREVRVHDRLSVERAILASSGFAHAKTILSADEERQTVLEPALVRREEADQPAKMIVMTVAQHQCIEPGRVDLQH